MLLNHSLIGGALLAALACVAACVGDLGGLDSREHREHREIRALASPPVGYTPLDPAQSIFSSAATPLGWETVAEQRHAEWLFANGEETPTAPPDSIGGGPEEFDDED